MSKSSALLVVCLAGTLAALGRLGAAPPAPTAAPPSTVSRPTPRPTPEPGRIRVVVTVVDKDKKSGPGVNAVAWIPGSAPPVVAPDATPAPRPKIGSYQKRFEPRVSVVAAGTTVDFPNRDRIHHNVFSLSPNATFDLGLYKNGATRPMTFDNPGLVRIYCNIHPQMSAFLLVVDGKNHALAGADGVATLAGVPAGRATVKVWDERSGEWASSVDVPAGGLVTVNATMDASSWRETPHKNKYGKEYPPPDDDENRY